MNILNLIIDIVIIICAIITVIFIFKNIYDIHHILKENHKPYFKLNLAGHIIDVEILLLVLWGLILLGYCVNKGANTMDSYIIDILINVGCSIGTTVVLSIVIYFKFLKHIPDETKKQIDTLLNDRLGYETTNHNALMHKNDEVRKSLSDEHTEIRQNINKATDKLNYISGELNTEKKLKELQHQYLNDNNKAIIENINKISGLGEILQEVNYENKILKQQNLNYKLENEKLTQENKELKQKLNQEFTQNNSFTQTL